MKKLVKIAAVGVIAAGMSSGAYAVDITIDTLTITSFAAQGGVGTNTDTQPGVGEIWANRTLTTNVLIAPFNFVGANSLVNAGTYSFSTDNQVDATFQVGYTGLFDITNGQTGGFLRLASLGTDVGGTNINYTLTDNASNTATASIFAPQTAAILNTSLASFAGVDLQNLTSLQIFIDPVAPFAADGSFSLIGTADFDVPPQVPAPATLLMLALGLLGMRRLRK